MSTLTPQQLVQLGRGDMFTPTPQPLKKYKDPLKPTISEMPRMAKERAELVKTSSIFQQQGVEAAQKRMTLMSPHFELMVEASTRDYIVAKNKTNGKLEIAFRGTDPVAKIQSGFGKGLPEPIMWGTILIGGAEGKIFDQHNLEQILKDLRNHNVNVSDIEHISGYSMGATKAHRLGDMIGKETTLFNPLLGENFFNKPINPRTKHEIYRVTEDIASTQGILRPGKKMPTNVTINSINPIGVLKEKSKGLVGTLEGVVALHDLDHFVGEGNRRGDLLEATETIDTRVETYQQERVGKTKEEQRDLQAQMLKDLAPHLQVIAQDAKRYNASTVVMRNVINVGKLATGKGAKKLAGAAGGMIIQKGLDRSNNFLVKEIGKEVRGALVGAAAGAATDAALESVGINDPYVKSTTAGAAGGIANEGAKVLLTSAPVSLLNFRNAALSGGTSAIVQVGSKQGLYAAMRAVGIDEDTSSIVSESTGGALGNATAVTVPGVLAAAALRSRIAAAQSVAAADVELAGVEMTTFAAEGGAELVAEGVAEAVAEGAAEVAVEASGVQVAEALALIPIPGARVLAGAVLLGTIVNGAFKAIQIATKPGVQVILHPTRSQVVDAAVADNARIKKLMEDFNKSKDRSEQAYTILIEDIESATRADPRIPSDFRYTAKLLRATEDEVEDVVRHFDYSNIPPEIANMTGTQFENAVGEAELYNQYRGIYDGKLTEKQKKDFIEEMKQKYGRDITRGENDSLDAQFVRALNKDESAAERLRSEIAVRAADEVYQQGLKIQQGIDDYNDEIDVTNQVHQKFAEFISTSPKVKEFIDNGDINGLNVFLHNSIRDRNIVGVMYNDLVATHNKHEVLDILHNNLPQFDASGKVSYITVADKPLEISAELQDKFTSQARNIRYANTYKEQSAKLADHPIGNALLNVPSIKQMIDKGSPPEDINQGINEYYKAHPTFRRSVDAGKITLPKFESDGSIKYTAARNPIPMSVQEQRAAHIARREQIHQIKPLDLGITPLPPQDAQAEPAPAQ
jgi:hypothetical protein